MENTPVHGTSGVPPLIMRDPWSRFNLQSARENIFCLFFLFNDMGVPEVLGDACHTYTNALGKSAVGLEHDAGSKQENVVP